MKLENFVFFSVVWVSWPIRRVAAASRNPTNMVLEPKKYETSEN